MQTKPLLLFSLFVLGACDDSSVPVTPEPATLVATVAGPPLFRDVAAQVGLNHQHYSGASGAFLFAEILGSGVALLDYDNDGDLDVYLIQSNNLDPAKSEQDALLPPPTGQAKGNRLMRNELHPTGELRFSDVTAEAGVGLDVYGMGVAVGDYDNDGDDDLYLANYRDNVLYKNNGDGTFSDVTAQLNANAPTWSTSAAFFDYDNDGDLDLFITSYVAYSLKLDQRCRSSSGNRDYCGPQNYQSLQDFLLRNDGDAGFVDVSKQVGVAAERGPGLGVTIADFDRDGWPDVFVANDGEANNVWMNQQGQTFEEMGLMSGTAYNRDGSPEASMGVTSGDYDGDGDEDLFMTHLINETNTLYANDGSGSFSDVTDRAGLGFGSKKSTGFGSAWFDYDNDGWLDLYIVNGDVKIEELLQTESNYAFDQPNQLYRNLGNGKFVEIETAAGDATGFSSISRGAAFGDLDNDGDIDVVVTNNSGPVRVLRNDIGNKVRALRLTLRGTQSNRNAYGALVAVERDGKPTLWRRVHSDGSYLSASDSRLLIGLGDAPDVAQVGVIWPSGLREVFNELNVKQMNTLEEGRGSKW